MPYNSDMLQKKISGFGYALKGIGIAWREELSFQIQIIVGVLVLILSYVFHISKNEFLIIILTVGAVLAVETLNTALEEFCDMVKGSHDPHVAKIKDLAAGAALLISMAAFAVGCIIFLPRIAALL